MRAVERFAMLLGLLVDTLSLISLVKTEVA